MVSFKEIYFAYQYKGKEKGDKGTYLMEVILGWLGLNTPKNPKITLNG